MLAWNARALYFSQVVRLDTDVSKTRGINISYNGRHSKKLKEALKMATLSEMIRFSMANAEGEERRRAGLSYTKLVPVPRTIAETAELAMNHKAYGLTAEELYKATQIMNGKK